MFFSFLYFELEKSKFSDKILKNSQFYHYSSEKNAI